MAQSQIGTVVEPRCTDDALTTAQHHAHAKPTPVGPLSKGRVACGTAAVALVVIALIATVRLLPPGGLPSTVVFVLGLLVIPLVASPAEWFVHRFVYHEPKLRPLSVIFTVHTAHHYGYFPTWRYVTAGPARRLAIRRRSPEAHLSPVRNAAVRLAHFMWYMAIGTVLVFVPAWLLTHRLAFFVGQLISCIVVSNLFIVVHDTIHRPHTHRIVEAQPWFAFLDNHHYIHHVALGANLNFLLPWSDLVFGTLRTTLTADEIEAHGTLSEAKGRPVGQGEHAWKARSTNGAADS